MISRRTHSALLQCRQSSEDVTAGLGTDPRPPAQSRSGNVITGGESAPRYCGIETRLIALPQNLRGCLGGLVVEVKMLFRHTILSERMLGCTMLAHCCTRQRVDYGRMCGIRISQISLTEADRGKSFRMASSPVRCFERVRWCC